MKIKTILASGAAASSVIASSAFAGGMDRATFSPSILFEQGNYAEVTLAQTLPSVTPAGTGSFFNVAESFKTLNFGYKHQFNDKVSLAFMYSSNPLGVAINYANFAFLPGLVAGLAPVQGYVDSESATLLGKYQATDRISVYGGLKHVQAKGSVNLGTGLLTMDSDSGTGFIAGAAYEIPDIAMRVSLSYESQIDFDLPTSSASEPAGTTAAGAPEAYTLEFQSGIAADTLLFGSIRHAKWSGADVVLANGFNLSEFDDSTAYTLGVGRKISDEFSMSLSLTYEADSGETVSLLSPTDGLLTVGLGGAYTGPQGVKTSMGISYSKRGDATTTTGGVPFADNEVITMGLKVSKSF